MRIFYVRTQLLHIVQGCLAQGEVTVNGMKFRVDGNGASAQTLRRADFDAFLGTDGFGLYDGDGTFLQDSSPKEARAAAYAPTQADLDANFTRAEQERIMALGGITGAVRTPRTPFETAVLEPAKPVREAGAPEDDEEYQDYLKWKRARAAKSEPAPEPAPQPTPAPQAPQAQALIQDPQDDPEPTRDEPVITLPGSEGDPDLDPDDELTDAEQRAARQAELEDLTVSELKALLASKDIEFSSRDNKGELIDHVIGQEFPTE